MKVFVTGASGYLGHAIACAFRREGHDVRGLCRSEDKARVLAASEIQPIVGDLARPDTYAREAAECAVLVHAASDSSQAPKADAVAVETLLEAAQSRAALKTLIYTSGVWVYGDTDARRPATEKTGLKPARAVSWRPDHERMVLSAKGVRSIVMRPGCVYGGRGSLTSMWFDALERDGAVSAVGDGTNHWSMLHLDDLARAYVSAPTCGVAGEIFNLADASRSSVSELVEAAAQAAGRPGAVTYVPVHKARASLGDLAECLALDQRIDATKAVNVLEWKPRHRGFVERAATYYAAWKAHQAQAGA